MWPITGAARARLAAAAGLLIRSSSAQLDVARRTSKRLVKRGRVKPARRADALRDAGVRCRTESTPDRGPLQRAHVNSARPRSPARFSAAENREPYRSHTYAAVKKQHGARLTRLPFCSRHRLLCVAPVRAARPSVALFSGAPIDRAAIYDALLFGPGASFLVNLPLSFGRNKTRRDSARECH